MRLIISLCLLAWLCACHTVTPQVRAVWVIQRQLMVGAGDEDMFMSDHASQMRTESQFLPAEKRGEEFYVAWSGPGIELVKFEYRQVGRPDKIAMQQFVPGRAQSHVFPVLGEEYRQGGVVSGWRASLWRGDQVLAEKKSSLW